ncbi:hypothetical protein [Yoonia sp. 2307UL14-13]|uniref:hypothetical protein n=1 Tax=Yoonia sp. 2307UL14-13 TaxID=3126506 RepID=UPI0030A2BD28
MSDQTTQNSSGNTGLAFLVGILVVVVAVMAYVMFADGDADGGQDLNITVEGAGAAAEDAAQAVEDGAEAISDDGN